MKISAFITYAILASTTTNAFSPPRPPVRHQKLALQLDLLGTEVDAAVLAAAGLALVGGIGVVVLKGQVKGEEAETTTVAPVATAPTPAPVVAAVPPPEPVDEVDISIPYDAAAKKAYMEAGSPGDYEEFKLKFEADAVADAIAKKKARDAA